MRGKSRAQEVRLHSLLSLCSVWVSFDDCHYAAFMALHVIGAKCLGFVVAGGMWRMCSKIFTAFQIGSYCEWARGGKGPGLITIVNQESVRYTQKKKKRARHQRANAQTQHGYSGSV